MIEIITSTFYKIVNYIYGDEVWKWIFQTFASPIAIFFTGWIIQRGIAEKKLEINKKNREEDILEKYLEDIQNLLLHYIFGNKLKSRLTQRINGLVFDIITTKTVTVLRRLNESSSKTIILLFLYNTSLIQKSVEDEGQINFFQSCNFSNIDLSEVDLSLAYFCGMNLSQTNFEEAELKKVDFSDANLEEANFKNSFLRGANFSNAKLKEANFFKACLGEIRLSKDVNNIMISGADFSHADLSHVDFSYADLSGVNFEGAYLFKTNFKGAKLKTANFKGAYLINVKNLTNSQIKSCCYWDQAYYKGDWDKYKTEWIYNETANKKFIKKIKTDKDSEPEKFPDYSRWKRWKGYSEQHKVVIPISYKIHL